MLYFLSRKGKKKHTTFRDVVLYRPGGSHAKEKNHNPCILPYCPRNEKFRKA
jgi:hypothetical protein